ncbi:cytochrome P450 [Streptomyces sp. NPDC054956]
MVPTLTYDPLDPDTLADPYPVLARLREQTPVFWHEGMRSWALTRYADCVAVLRDHQQFARDPRRTGSEVPEASLSVQVLDPPDQAEIRTLFLAALHAQDLTAVEDRARRRAAGLLDDLADRDRFDVMADLAAPLAVAVIADLLGVEEPEPAEFAAVSDAIMRSMDGGLDPSLVEPGRIARQQLSEMVAAWFAAGPRPGLLAHVRAHTPAGDLEAELYVRNTARVMFQGGYSTMVAAIGNAAYTLLQHPDAQDRLRRDSGLLATAVDELVRFDGPVQGTSRTATTACELARIPIAAGEKVVLLFAAANHDPAQFAQPDSLLLDRPVNRHLGFGWGTHSCIGTRPAQAALRALLSAFLAHPAPLRTAGGARRRRTATMRTFEALPAALRELSTPPGSTR